MARCTECGTLFDIDDARDDYNAEFNGELDYDEDFVGTKCGNCAISQSASEINVGAAIDMMNGEIEYDADHVEKYL
ncbi:hypothetical protein SAMN04489806_1095 [Paramicrobacterium humi]|uniref:Uncharacterized protein n=1 Tax=Paramicrobacterium humi TaxID=640635 RepID=A0A1H4KBR9_9MICO|nr:hypothetical protein [Microbacterium humi]SEB55575.1 hypothetical protein SAMN04489806_1095 [Microbacterium humi]